jgi:PadR family transcriptional regulator PadR
VPSHPGSRRHFVDIEIGKLSVARVLGELASISEEYGCALGNKGVGCLHLDVDGLQPMTTKDGYQNRIELLQGTLDMLILKTLQWGELHGYGISQAIRATSAEVLRVETGSLYPALHRLERQGWVKAEWKKSESNQRAKFYKITKLGKGQLASDYERWGKMVATIEGIMTAK